MAQREARIFFAQARNLQTPLASVEHEGQTVFSHGHDGVTARPAEEAEAEARAAPREAAEEQSQPSDAGSDAGSDASESPEDEYAASDADASSDDYDVSRESRRGRRRSSGAR